MLEDILICMLVSHPAYVVPGSTSDLCSNPDCRKPVWVSPSSRRILQGHPEVEILCADCAYAKIAQKGGEFQKLNSEQETEIGQYRKRN